MRTLARAITGLVKTAKSVGAIRAQILKRSIAGFVALWLFPAATSAQFLPNELPSEARGVDVVDRLGSQVPSPVMIRTAEGEAIDIARYFDGRRPVVLLLVYYDCPLICPKILGDVGEVVAKCRFEPGRDYNLVVVSIDPENTDAMALQAKQDMLDAYTLLGGRTVTQEVRDGFAFHTASGGASSRIADSVGFRYKRIRNGEYSHPAALIILSPEGVVTRYLKAMTQHLAEGGKDTDDMARDLRFALLEASDGKIARSFGDWFIHRCFTFDPTSGTYTRDAMAVMRLAGGATVIALAGGIGVLLLGERSRRAMRRRHRHLPDDSLAQTDTDSTVRARLEPDPARRAGEEHA